MLHFTPKEVPVKSLAMLAAVFSLVSVLPTVVSADVIASTSFETSGDTWTFGSNAVIPYNVSGNVWAPQTSRTITGPHHGSLFWCAQDLVEVNANGNGGALTEFHLTFATLDISAYNDVQVSFYYNAIAVDPNENIFYQIDTGSGFGDKVNVFAPVAFNETTNGWQQATINIPNSATSIALRIGTGPGLIGVGATENIGFDLVQLTGTLVPEPGSMVLVALGGLLCIRRRTSSR